MISIAIYCINLTVNSCNPPCQFLRDQILKKTLLREMLIEQIIEFELRWPGPPGRT